MFVVGHGTKLRSLGEGPVMECPNCHNPIRAAVVEMSRRASVMFVPVAKWDAQYWMVCPICDRGVQIESRLAAQDLLVEAAQFNAELDTRTQGLGM